MFRRSDSKPIRVWFVGPDGSGKTTAAGLLADKLESEGKTVARLHWGRPKVADVDSSAPHDQTPRSRVLSNLALGSHVARFLLFRPRSPSADVIICERVLLDTNVDRRRYRLHPAAISSLRLLKLAESRPDLVVLMAGEAAVLDGVRCWLTSGRRCLPNPLCSARATQPTCREAFGWA